MSVKSLLTLVLISLLTLSACSGPAASQPTPTPEPVALKVSVLPFLSYAPFFIAQDEGIFAEQGLQVEFVKIERTSEAMPALAQGQIDVAAGFFDVSTLNAIAQGGKIKYVSDKGYLDPNGCAAATFVARKDLIESGKLDDLSNLKGMKIALTPASSAEYALDMLLKDVGLSSKDVEILNIPLAARFEGLGSGAVDIAAVSDPWTVRAVNAGYGEIWHPWHEYLPNFQFSIIMYGPNLLEKRPDVGVRFMVAYLKAVAFYNQGKTDRNVEIIAKYTQLTPEEVKAACWMSMRSDGSVDLAGMAGFQDWAIAKGLMDTRVSNEQLWDPQFIEKAAAALKGQ